MLEGPCEGFMKDVAFEKLTPWTDPLPAGQERKAVDGESEVNAEKAANAEAVAAEATAEAERARAHAIFGKQ